MYLSIKKFSKVANTGTLFWYFFVCDHIKTFTFDLNIPNLNLNTSVVADITYGSKKWAELIEIDWIGRLKRRITDIKKTKGWSDLELLN